MVVKGHATIGDNNNDTLLIQAGAIGIPVNQAVRIGYGTVAPSSSQNQIAIGRMANAQNLASIAIGSTENGTNLGPEASGIQSIAIGTPWITAPMKATENNSIAIGTGAQSTADDSIAFGVFAIASQLNSIAIGGNANGSGTSSIAIGSTATALPGFFGPEAQGVRAIAIGSTNGGNTQALGMDAIAIGSNARATVANAVAIGTNASSAVINRIQLGNADHYVVVGSPATAPPSPQGGDLYANRLYYDTSSGIYDIVFDKYFDGKLSESDQKIHGDYKIMSLTEMIEYIERERHLPTIPGKKELEKIKYHSVDDFKNYLWQTVEVQALYIKELHERNEDLQRELASMKEAQEKQNKKIEEILEKLKKHK